MMRILGIDPSMTSTGVAVITDNPLRAVTHRIQSGPPKRVKGDKTPATLGERSARVREIVGQINVSHAMHYEGVLAIVEAPSYGSQGSGTWDRAWLWGAIIDRLIGNDIPVAIVPPATRTLWATGSGRASKGQVAVPMSRMWPDLDAGISDDEWDALSLATIGAQHLGLVPTELARHQQQLAKVTWPDIPAGIAA